MELEMEMVMAMDILIVDCWQGRGRHGKRA
jgi:hypothetical protein